MQLFLTGITTIFAQPVTLLWICLGVTLGVVFGALPGISATMAIVLCISFTYSMNPVIAISFLAAVYCASITGGSITAILFKIPGTPSSVATCFDGHPMVKKGQAAKALGDGSKKQEYLLINSDHGFNDQRIYLAQKVAEYLADLVE